MQITAVLVWHNIHFYKTTVFGFSYKADLVPSV